MFPSYAGVCMSRMLKHRVSGFRGRFTFTGVSLGISGYVKAINAQFGNHAITACTRPLTVCRG